MIYEEVFVHFILGGYTKFYVLNSNTSLHEPSLSGKLLWRVSWQFPQFYAKRTNTSAASCLMKRIQQPKPWRCTRFFCEGFQFYAQHADLLSLPSRVSRASVQIATSLPESWRVPSIEVHIHAVDDSKTSSVCGRPTRHVQPSVKHTQPRTFPTPPYNRLQMLSLTAVYTLHFFTYYAELQRSNLWLPNTSITYI